MLPYTNINRSTTLNTSNHIICRILSFFKYWAVSTHIDILHFKERERSMKNRCTSFLRISKPYLAMMSLQFWYAGMNIITKVSLNRGMSHYVLVVYRHAFATAVIAPFAFFFERYFERKNKTARFTLFFFFSWI